MFLDLYDISKDNMAIVLCDNDMTRNLGYKYRIKDLCGTHIFLNVVILSRPGHEKPRTEDRTKKTENRSRT